MYSDWTIREEIYTAEGRWEEEGRMSEGKVDKGRGE
jgi:hypothetical protein